MERKKERKMERKKESKKESSKLVLAYNIHSIHGLMEQ